MLTLTSNESNLATLKANIKKNSKPMKPAAKPVLKFVKNDETVGSAKSMADFNGSAMTLRGVK